MTLLRIDSSARATSVTRSLTAAFAEAWRNAHPTAVVVHRDLSATALPHITDGWLATAAEPASLTEDQRAYLATSDQLIAELLAAGVVVIGAPLYNLTVSEPLKAWIDQVVRLGKTVAVGPQGARGLLAGRAVVVITSRGGRIRPDNPGVDFQEPYLRRILETLGLSPVAFVHAENQRDRERGEAGRRTALEQIEQIIQHSQGEPS